MCLTLIGKIMAKIFKAICMLFLIKSVLMDSCNQRICYCLNHMISCVNVVLPRFYLRPAVTVLYLERVHLNDMKSIMRSFPSLEYLTLKDMKYFKCEWMNDITEGINIRSNMCQTTINTGK